MTISDLFEKLKIPLIVIIIFFIVSTYVLCLTESAVNADKWVYRLFDLRKERSLATWFEGVLFLIVALSFAVIGWSDAKIPLNYKNFYKLTALGCCFLSADEIISIHENFGRALENTTKILMNTQIEGRGFSWLFLYVPISLSLILILVYISIKIITKTLHHPKNRREAFSFLTIGLIGVPAVFVLEGLEAYFWNQGSSYDVPPCLEELMELTSLYSFWRCNSLIIKNISL